MTGFRLVNVSSIFVLVIPAVAFTRAADVVSEGLVLNYDFTAGSVPGEDGVVQMDNGEIALICSWNDGKSERPVIAFSKDGGETWTTFQTIPGAGGRPINLAYLGKGRLTFRSNKRFFSSDYGRTWPESTKPKKTTDGFPFSQEGNAWVDFDENGEAVRIAELGWHYKEGKWPTGAAIAVIRWSTDGARTWHNEVHPKTWIYDTKHAGKTYLRGVSEGALVRAANGWLVAAVRTDMPPRFFNVAHSDHFEGTGVSISKDDGKTWSELNWLVDAGRMHANLQRLPNGDLVMTVIVRQDVVTETMGKYASFRRGCDAWVSRDNGLTWNVSRKYTLYAFDYPDPAKQYPVVCGHIGAAVLDDGSVLSACGDYPRGASVLVKWRPDAEPARPVSAEALVKEAAARAPRPTDTMYNHVAKKGRHYEVRRKPGQTPQLVLNRAGWIHVPLDDRIAGLTDEATIELVLRPENQGTFATLLCCGSIAPETPGLCYTIAYDHTRMADNPQILYSDERVERTPMHHSVMVHSGSSPKPFEPVMQQIAYVVTKGRGTFYRDGKPFSQQKTAGKADKEALFKFCVDKAGGKETLRLGIGARPLADRVNTAVRAGFAAVRIYNRPLTPEELKRNREATLGPGAN